MLNRKKTKIIYIFIALAFLFVGASPILASSSQKSVVSNIYSGVTDLGSTKEPVSNVFNSREDAYEAGVYGVSQGTRSYASIMEKVAINEEALNTGLTNFWNMTRYAILIMVTLSGIYSIYNFSSKSFAAMLENRETVLVGVKNAFIEEAMSLWLGAMLIIVAMMFFPW